ncbi:protein SSUH2 homolog isoform X2 [Clytia hemisphaerica]|uniref:Protein SSUH2 homolog n=1 Tax=Clytia hemisphaerica TaxID=252671 RepID=A0A7M5WZS0_9CNID
MAKSSLNNSNTRRARTLTEEDAAEAFADFVADGCCYSNNLSNVKNSVRTKKITARNYHQYVLETFYEERTTVWHQEPYVDQTIDGMENGCPTHPWNIPVSMPSVFQPHQLSIEVPHTAFIKDCSTCRRNGSRKCSSCQGCGKIKCGVCDGLGVLQLFSPDELTFENSTSITNRSCPHCNGGNRECKKCQGNGKIICFVCQGHGALKVSTRLIVKWKLMKDERIIERSHIPKQLFKEISGTSVFQEQNDRVYPLLDFPENGINDLSAKLIKGHNEQLKHAKIRMQRHFVKEVPVAKVQSEWNKKEFTYWVYGNENRVFCPRRPTKCSVM